MADVILPVPALESNIEVADVRHYHLPALESNIEVDDVRLPLPALESNIEVLIDVT